MDGDIKKVYMFIHAKNKYIPKYDHIFEIISNKKQILDKNMPILNYCDYLTNYYLENSYIKPENVYNLTYYKPLSYEKKLMHQLLINDPHVPKTVFSKSDALEKLKFPIIAKPSNGHSGIGIKIFKDRQSLVKNIETHFDIFSELIDKDKEYRFFLFKGKPYYFLERTPLNNKAKRGTGDSQTKMKFIYTRRDLSKINRDMSLFIDRYTEFFEWLPVLAFDVMVDQNGKYYLIEINTAMGLPYDTSLELYKKIYQDFYGKKCKINSNISEILIKNMDPALFR